MVTNSYGGPDPWGSLGWIASNGNQAWNAEVMNQYAASTENNGNPLIVIIPLSKVGCKGHRKDARVRHFGGRYWVSNVSSRATWKSGLRFPDAFSAQQPQIHPHKSPPCACGSVWNPKFGILLTTTRVPSTKDTAPYNLWSALIRLNVLRLTKTCECWM